MSNSRCPEKGFFWSHFSWTYFKPIIILEFFPAFFTRRFFFKNRRQLRHEHFFSALIHAILVAFLPTLKMHDQFKLHLLGIQIWQTPILKHFLRNFFSFLEKIFKCPQKEADVVPSPLIKGKFNTFELSG